MRKRDDVKSTLHSAQSLTCSLRAYAEVETYDAAKCGRTGAPALTPTPRGPLPRRRRQNVQYVLSRENESRERGEDARCGPSLQSGQRYDVRSIGDDWCGQSRLPVPAAVLPRVLSLRRDQVYAAWSAIDGDTLAYRQPELPCDARSVRTLSDGIALVARKAKRRRLGRRVRLVRVVVSSQPKRTSCESP